MAIQAHVYYLAATFAVLGLAWRRGGVSFDCTVALLAWYCLANTTYIYGQVETTGTLIAALVYLVICYALVRKHDHHWLPLYLLTTAGAIILWNALYADDDPYIYKAVKNGLYLGELLAVTVSIWTTPKR